MRWALLLSMLALGGCVAGPNYAPPAPAVQNHAFLRGSGDASAAAPLARWWEGLGDTQLSQLIGRGLAQAPSLAAAQARLRQARASYAGDRAMPRRICLGRR
jgi:outer membrane protein TolC